MIPFLILLSIFLGSLGAWLIYRHANSIGLLDHSNNRSSHKGVIPKGGGIGVLATFVMASIFSKISPAFLVSATIISIISFLGDRREISPKLRLPVQFIATFLFLLQASYHCPLISDFWLLTYVFFTLFIIATTNWYNFMDGINGIAGITAVLGFSMLAYFNFASKGDSNLTILSLCIVFACLGFLPFNFPKARVFMGDVGSILLGFVFAALVVIISKSFLDFVCLAGFLFPFYADEFVTIAVRLKDSENLLKAHRRHFYQLLANEMGIAHWKISIGYGIMQLIVGLSVLLVKPSGIIPVICILSLFFAGFILANIFVRIKIGKRKE